MVGYRDRGVPDLGRDVLSRHDDRDGAEVDHEDHHDHVAHHALYFLEGQDRQVSDK